MTNVSGNLFQNYLLNNEKWLATEGEEKGQHQVDGQLDESEISVFFSSSHIEFGGESGDGEISDSEFESWYAANESAISAFLEANDMDYETGKDAMRESMVDFAHGLDSEYIAEEHGMSVNSLDMNGVWNDRDNAGLPPVVPADEEQIPVEEPEKTEEPKEETSTTYGTTTITTQDADSIARQLYNDGSFDKDKAMKTLLNADYTSADIVMIMRAYEEGSNHSLMSDIQTSMSGKNETKLRERLYEAAADEAQKAFGWTDVNSIPEDIKADAESLYSKTGPFSLAYSWEVNRIFNMSDSDEAKVMTAFSMMYSNSADSALSRITEGKAYTIGTQSTEYEVSENEIINSFINSLLLASQKQ